MWLLAPRWCVPGGAQAASQHGLGLVSPAVSTTGIDNYGVSPWLDQFFGNCSVVPGCNQSQIDYIAFHDYQGDPLKIISKVHSFFVGVWLGCGCATYLP